MHALEKEMADGEWKIPGMEEPGGLPFIGSHRVRHDCSDLAAGKNFHLICILHLEIRPSQCQ